MGKAEAVRRGLQLATGTGAVWVGYCDADMATPVDELLRLQSLATGSDSLAVVLAARVGLLGSRIERSPRRHYLGRVFAAAASTVLGVRIYDTQCGAKLFRASPALESALSAPFHSRWSFDVELIGRLLRGRPGVAPLHIAQFVEVPLNEWRDVDGSKLTVRASVRSGLELLTMAWHLRRW